MSVLSPNSPSILLKEEMSLDREINETTEEEKRRREVGFRVGRRQPALVGHGTVLVLF